MGNAEGWAQFKLKTGEQGAATHVYAAFEPNLKGENESIVCLSMYGSLLIRSTSL